MTVHHGSIEKQVRHNFSVPEEKMLICWTQFWLCATQDIAIITYCLSNIKHMKSWLAAHENHYSLQNSYIVGACTDVDRD